MPWRIPVACAPCEDLLLVGNRKWALFKLVEAMEAAYFDERANEKRHGLEHRERQILATRNCT